MKENRPLRKLTCTYIIKLYSDLLHNSQLLLGNWRHQTVDFCSLATVAKEQHSNTREWNFETKPNRRSSAEQQWVV